jgi:glucose/arabinose dehydrogenase
LLTFLFSLLSATAQPFGLTNRVANTTLQMPPTIPVLGFTTTNAFPGLVLNTPYGVATPPGETNRLFIFEKAGRIVVITNLANPVRTVFLDITDRVLSAANEEGLYGLAFHPGYATNRIFCVTYTCNSKSTNLDHSVNTGLHDRVSMFKTSTTNANVALPSSEVVLINQYDEDSSHQAGDAHFGPDGYLYVSLGDEGSGYDTYQNAQRIDKDFFSGIIRIDVDKRAGNLKPNMHPASSTNYSIPNDNPFIHTTNFNGITVNSNNVRSEFYAIGMRNPWRFSFNQLNGDLLVADVGQERWEELNRVVKGGNYGWAYREGYDIGPKWDIVVPGFTNWNDPILSYPHGTEAYQGDSIIGGVVCTNPALPQINGAYIFGDFIIGNIWMLRYASTNVTQWDRITTEPFPSSFGNDPSTGDVLIVKHLDNVIKRIVYVTNTTLPQLPATLADTGAFSDVANLIPNPGVIPYNVNAPFWSDNTQKTRWFSLPDTNTTITFNADANWTFPAGAVWVKHFELAMTNGVASSNRRIETRFLVKNTNGVYGVTYRWGGSTTNATLVPDEGLDESFVISDAGILRTQIWHYPARNECIICHTTAGGQALGFNTAQLNLNFTYGEVTDNQIRAMNHAGYFSTDVTNINTLRALVDPSSTNYSLDYRVHSYLAANCVYCHQSNAPAAGNWDARINVPIWKAGIIDGALENNFFISGNRIIAPGSLEFSILLKRVSSLDYIRMPPLASRMVNMSASNVLAAWILNLTNYQAFTNYQIAKFGSTNCPTCTADSDRDGDGVSNYLEYLTGTDPLNSNSFWRISAAQGSNTAQIIYPQLANRGYEVQFITNVTSANWQPLDVPDNRSFFSPTNRTGVVNDPSCDGERYYRVRVFEP